MKIVEESKELLVVEGYDITVVGGGIAGVVSAVAAARHGQKVLLIEKMFGLGGLATLGNVIHFLPICDGVGNKVIGGICEELLLLADEQITDNKDLGLKKAPLQWGKNIHTVETSERYANIYNPNVYQIQLEKLLKDNGVDILYDTRFCDVILSKDQLTHIVIENKDGRQAVASKAFIDCSGDADLFYAAGEKTISLDSNVLCGWHYLWTDGVMKLQKFSKPYSSTMFKDGLKAPFFSGDNAKDITDMVLQSRELFLERIEGVRCNDPDKVIELFEIPSIPCFRATRRFAGDYTLSQDDAYRWFDDAVAMTGDWRRRGPVYAVPLRCLKSNKYDNLFVAGRCISSKGDTWDITRSIPTCGSTGHAVGVAAAMIAENGKIDVDALQKILKYDGQIIDKKLLDGSARMV
jgi:hypothetical protein